MPTAQLSIQKPYCLSYKDHFCGSMKVFTVPQRAGLGGCKAICFVRQLDAQTRSVCLVLWFLLKTVPRSFSNLCLTDQFFSAQPIYIPQSLGSFNSHQSLEAPSSSEKSQQARSEVEPGMRAGVQLAQPTCLASADLSVPGEDREHRKTTKSSTMYL